MIRTDRQLKTAQKQLILLREGLLNERRADSHDIHPVIAEASIRGLNSQIEELSAEISEYEDLRSGRTPAPDLSDLANLHTKLVQSRIALGLTQADLASRLGVAEQQIQRYEATEYAGASLSRLREIAQALRPDEPVTSTEEITTLEALTRRLLELGVSKSIVDRHIALDKSAPGNFATSAVAASRLLGANLDGLLSSETMDLPTLSPAFKLPRSTRSSSLPAIARYGERVADIVSRTVSPGSSELEPSPDAVNSELLARGGANFENLLSYAWSCGIVVVPLSEPGSFNAAYWPSPNCDVIILKQGHRSTARWTFDLAHEMCHVADFRSGKLELDSGFIDDDTVTGWASDPREQRANKYAARVTLGPHAEELTERVAKLAQGRVEYLKSSVSRVAEMSNAPVAYLANQIAHLVARDGVNWWGAASNLDSDDTDPWQTARDFLLMRIDFSQIDAGDRRILIQVLSF